MNHSQNNSTSSTHPSAPSFAFASASAPASASASASTSASASASASASMRKRKGQPFEVSLSKSFVSQLHEYLQHIGHIGGLQWQTKSWHAGPL